VDKIHTGKAGTMKPKTVNILGINYSISYMDNPSDVDIDKRKSLWGQIDFWTRTIRIYDNDRNIEDIWQTLIHEVIHGISSSLNLKLDETDEAHDNMDVLALALTDVMFRNDWIKLKL